MEQKMKRIPFDLELAKQGVAFRLTETDNTDNYYIADFQDKIWFKWTNELTKEELELLSDIDKIKDAFHLIPDEPKPERYVVTYPLEIYDNVKRAQLECDAKNSNLVVGSDYQIIKLAY